MEPAANAAEIRGRRNPPAARPVPGPVTPEPTERAAQAEEFSSRLEAAQGALRAYAGALVAGRGPIDPDDVVQEALHRAWTHRASFDEGRALLPWLKRVALRALLDLRDRHRSSTLDVEVTAPGEDGVAAQDEVRALLARLPAREAELLDRFHRRGESVQELARSLDLPEGTVKSLLHRARRRLAAEGRR